MSKLSSSNSVQSPSCPKNEDLSSEESDTSGAPLLEKKLLPASLLKINEDKTEKLSLNGTMSSVEASAVSENERCDSVSQAEDHDSITWDVDQDFTPYLSEPYSEQKVDEDEVKKLINFGDDYRAMLSSYSDGSSVSLKAPKSFKSRSKSSWHRESSRESHDSLMSDSDSEDFNHMMKDSNRALQCVMEALKKNRDAKSYSEFTEWLATCQTNLSLLHTIHQEVVTGCELEALSKDDILRLQELIKAWEALQVEILKLKPKTEELEATIIDVHCCLASLKEKLDMMARNAVKAGEKTECLNQVKSSIRDLQSGLSYLQDMKEAVLEVTSRILKLIQKKEHLPAPSLRDAATKLSQQWEDVYELNCSQLTKLQGLQSRWYEATESATQCATESTLGLQSVQVGNCLPKPKVSSEEPFHYAAAEVQDAEVHYALLQMKTNSRDRATCCHIEDVPIKVKDPSCIMVSPVIKTEGQEQENPLSVNSHSKAGASARRSTFWRSLRASVPIQFALVTLYCLSSLMDPNCCENMNNFDTSFFLHFSFPGGQPPV